VLLIGSLTACGYESIEPVQDSNSLFKLPGFTIPKPTGKGQSPQCLTSLRPRVTVLVCTWDCPNYSVVPYELAKIVTPSVL